MLKVALTETGSQSASDTVWRVDVAVHTPAHAALDELLSYTSAAPVAAGTLVRVPLGRREVLGVAWQSYVLPPSEAASLKPIAAVLDDLPPLGSAWRDLVAFAGRYYRRSLGEIALSTLPPQLRDLSGVQLARRLKRQRGPSPAPAEAPATPAEATPEQVLREIWEDRFILEPARAEPG